MSRRSPTYSASRWEDAILLALTAGELFGVKYRVKRAYAREFYWFAEPIR